MHLLLIEPNPILAHTYMDAFKHAGFTVAHATGAQAAIDAADEKRPDVVILEIQLAAHNGFEFLHEFRSYAEWQQVPAIIHTMIPPTQMQAVKGPLNNDLGVRATLYKPRTTLQQLLSTVREVAVV